MRGLYSLRGLYPLCDVDALARVGLEPLAFVDAVLAASPKPALVQLRAKSWEPARILALLQALVPRAEAAGVPLVVNDHPALARGAAARMVHLGQNDAPEQPPRDLAHGRSTHDLDQLRRALAEAPAYVAYGPVYATASKSNPEAVVGLDGLQAAHALTRARGIPLCAIGGIDAGRLVAVAPHCELVAVIGVLVHPDPVVVTERAGRLAEALLQARNEPP